MNEFVYAHIKSVCDEMLDEALQESAEKMTQLLDQRRRLEAELRVCAALSRNDDVAGKSVGKSVDQGATNNSFQRALRRNKTIKEL